LKARGPFLSILKIDSIADSIHLIDSCQSSLWANEFLRMLVNPKHYRMGWIDYLKVVAVDTAKFFRSNHSLGGHGLQIEHEAIQI
jgi:hypothetical protein